MKHFVSISRNTWVVCGILFISVLIIYGRAAGYPLIWDSRVTVLHDEGVKHLSSVLRFFMEPSTPDVTGLDGRDMESLSFYRPLARAATALQYAVFHDREGAYHAVSVLLHACVLVLLFLLVRDVTNRPGLALASVLLFSANPLNVEAVAWVHSATTLWMMMGAAGCLLLYHRKHYVGSILCFVAALLFRETSALIVGLVAAYELAYGKKETWKEGLIRVLIFVVIGGGFYFIRNAVAGGLDVSSLGIATWINTCVMAFFRLMLGWVWPGGPVVHYLYEMQDAFSVELVMAYATAAAWLILGIWLLLRRRALFFWYGWASAWMVIHLAVGQSGTYLAAEKQMYPVGIGLSVLVCMLLATWRWGGAVLLAILVTQAAYSSHRVGYYADEARFLSAAVDASPDLHLARYQLANLLAQRQQNEAARTHYEKLLEAWPNHSGLYNNLGNIHMRLGERESALDAFHKAYRLDPSNLKAAGMLAQLKEQAGDLEAALVLYEAYQRGNPGDAWSAQKVAHLRHRMARAAGEGSHE